MKLYISVILFLHFFNFYNCLRVSPIEIPDFTLSEKNEDTITVKKGGLIYMYVRTTDEGDLLENDEWKTCTWTRKKDGKRCRYNYVCKGTFCALSRGTWSIETQCDNELKDHVKFVGEDPKDLNTLCGIKILKAQSADNSDWEVSVEECQLTGCFEPHGNGVFLKETTKVTVV